MIQFVKIMKLLVNFTEDTPNNFIGKVIISDGKYSHAQSLCQSFTDRRIVCYYKNCSCTQKQYKGIVL